MAVNILQVVFGILLIFVVPGVMLIKAMFPRPGELDEEYNGLYVLTLGMATSVCLTILVGFVLGSLPPQDGKGYFAFPYIVTSLLGLTAVFFVAGWWRGAYPWLGLLHPKLARFPIPASAPRGTKRHDELLARIGELSKEHDRLKQEVRDLLRRERKHGKTMAEHYKERRVEAEKELEEVREKLEIAKEEQSKLIYEAKQHEDARRKRREQRRQKRESDRESKMEKHRKLPGAKEEEEEAADEDADAEDSEATDAETPDEDEEPRGEDE